MANISELHCGAGKCLIVEVYGICRSSLPAKHTEQDAWGRSADNRPPIHTDTACAWQEAYLIIDIIMLSAALPFQSKLPLQILFQVITCSE